MILHSTSEQVTINLIFFGVGSGLLVTLDAIIILFIPKALMATSAALMNTMRIIGGAIGPILSSAIMQEFLVQVTVDGKEELFRIQSDILHLRDPWNSFNGCKCIIEKQCNLSDFSITGGSV
jgi:MFS family permease